MIVSFSGMDGAGKTTQISLLKAALKSKGLSPKIVWSRGGYTPGFECLKKTVRRLFRKTLPSSGHSKQRKEIISRPFVSYIWLYLAILDLIFLYGVKLRFSSGLGTIFICDRYLDDTRLDFHLNFKTIEFQKMWMWKLLEILTPTPDVSFLLLLPVEISMARSLLKDEPFPDDKETLIKRLCSYTDEADFSDNTYLRLNGEEAKEAIGSKVQYEVFTRLGIHKS